MKGAPRATMARSGAEHGVRPPAQSPAAPRKDVPRLGNRAMARMFGETSGRPLEPGLRQEMESGFGADFSGVRVHVDARGERSARALKARAATYGGDIVFARGEYAPGAPEGRRLIAHELAHVVQQSGGYGPAPSPHPQGFTESDATQAASAVASGGRANVHVRSAPGIARQEVQSIVPPSPAPAAQVRAKAPAVAAGNEEATLTNALKVLDSIKQVGSNAHEVVIDGQTRRLTQADVDAAYGKTRAALGRSLSSIRIKAEGAAEGYAIQSKVNEEFPVVSRAVKLFGGIDDPGDEIASFARHALELVNVSRAELDKGHFSNAGRLMSLAELLAKKAERKYNDYHNNIISTGETTITVLEFTRDAAFITLAVLATVATAGAAAGLTSVAGLEIGTVATANSIALFTPLAAKLGEAGVKLAYGDRVDWGQLAVEAVVTIVIAKFAPQLANSIAGRIIGQSPAAASVGRHVVAGIVSGLVSGRASAVLSSSVNVAYAKLRGKNVTWEGFIEQTAATFLDPKSAGLDLVLGAIGTYRAGSGVTTGGAPSHETPLLAHTEPAAPKLAPKPSGAIAAKSSAETSPSVVANAPAKPVARPQVGASAAPALAAKAPATPAPKAPAAKGPVVEETRIRSTVIRRRRGPADPTAPASEKQAAPEEKPLTPAERKEKIAAEAREEMKALGEHERENATPENVPEHADEVRDRPNLRESEIHSPTHPDILGAALERAGMPRPPGHDPHHIVPSSGGGQAGDRARAVIDRARIHGDSADNGVWLPRTTLDPRNVPSPAPIDPRFSPEGLTRHQTIHTKRYYEEIAARLEAAEGKRSISDTLRDIRTEIADGKFPH
jgi:Domain of unknown function (DUF4157)/A nuclease family of the HNH/ENDO VII superfamily with conserved AHH